MSRIKPSPAVLVAVVALVAALGGSAVAEVATTSKLSKGEKKRVGKIAAKKAKKRDAKQDERNFPIESSQIADGAVTEAKIANGLPPKAWANISRTGGVVAAEGLSATNVTKASMPGTGGYCFEGIDATTAQATAGVNTALDLVGASAINAASIASAFSTFEDIGCPLSTTWAVRTHKASDGSLTDSSFQIAFWD